MKKGKKNRCKTQTNENEERRGTLAKVKEGRTEKKQKKDDSKGAELELPPPPSAGSCSSSSKSEIFPRPPFLDKEHIPTFLPRGLCHLPRGSAFSGKVFLHLLCERSHSPNT